MATAVVAAAAAAAATANTLSKTRGHAWLVVQTLQQVATTKA